MPRPTKDAKHEKLASILQAMLEADEQITARSVIARHPNLASASAITRHPERLALVKDFAAKQNSMRAWAQRTQKQSRSHLAKIIATKDEQIAKLEGDVRTLIEAHLSLIALVAETGGVRRLRTFYEQHSTLRKRLALRKALPDELHDT